LVLLLLTLPAVAGAHATLEGTEPSNDQVVKQAPAAIKFTFSENVDIAFGGIKVFGPDGKLADTGKVSSHDGKVSLPISARSKGTYAVSWRAISADGHPVRGAFTYHVKTKSGGAAQKHALAASSSSRGQAIAFGVARGVALLGLLGAVGAALFGSLIAPGVTPRWVRTFLAALIVGSVVAFVLDATIAGGFSISEALKWSVLKEEASTVYGRATLIRFIVAICAVEAFALFRTRWRDVGVAVFVLLGMSQSLSGHAIADPVSFRLPFDMLHTLAAAIWLGGLVQLRWATPLNSASLPAIKRYSDTAFVSVIVLVLTGLYASYMEIGFSWEAASSTTYGRLVLIKSALYLVLLGFGAVNRKISIPAIERSDSDGALRRFIVVEVLILVGVVALTAWLIAAVPAKNQLKPKLFDRTLKLNNGGSAQIVIDPAKAGSNKVHIYVLDKTLQLDGSLQDLRMEAANSKLDISHLNIDLNSAGPGHYTTNAASIPYAGKWRFNVFVKYSKFDQEIVPFSADIAPTT
jgi:copper transport protein